MLHLRIRAILLLSRIEIFAVVKKQNRIYSSPIACELFSEQSDDFLEWETEGWITGMHLCTANYYTPRRQASRRWRPRPWWLWSRQGGSHPSRRAPSMLSSRRMVSSDRFSSVRGRQRGMGSDRDHLPPGPSGLASSVLLLGSTGGKLMPWHSRASS